MIVTDFRFALLLVGCFNFVCCFSVGCDFVFAWCLLVIVCCLLDCFDVCWLLCWVWHNSVVVSVYLHLPGVIVCLVCVVLCLGLSGFVFWACCYLFVRYCLLGLVCVSV